MPPLGSPHFALPFRIRGARGAVVNEQNTEAEILDCVETILRYRQGDRPEAPDFGIPDMTFYSPEPDNERIRTALAEWEPRIDMEVGEPIIDQLDALISKISVEKEHEVGPT
jgi:phage baseplate assembly protein W